ncbi:MAG TPA: hypothetical protein VGL29_04615 [Blastocatellia bacterium]
MRFVIVAAKVIAKSSASNNSKPDLTQRMWKATMMSSFWLFPQGALFSFYNRPSKLVKPSMREATVALQAPSKARSGGELRTRHRRGEAD